MVNSWAVPLVCGLVAAIGLIAWIRGRDRRVQSVAYVAHTRLLRLGTRYRSRMTKLRMAAMCMMAAMVVVTLSASVILARPSEMRANSSKLASRDLVLCLDISGSVTSFDAQVLETFAEMVNQFKGERVALVVWNKSASVIFPLSDDYDMVKEELNRIKRVLQGTGSMSDENDLQLRTDAGDYGRGSSLIGDGLVSCTQSFDYGNKQRSRSILFATDNALEGTPLFQLDEAVKVAKKRNIRVLGLLIESYQRSSSKTSFRKEIKGIGGKVYDAASASSGDQIIKNIQAQDKKELASNKEVFVVDTPGVWPMLAGLGVLLIVLLAWRYRL
jgi:von Willebrand factor type A domain.